MAEDLIASLPSGTLRGWRVGGGAIPGVASPGDAELTVAIRRLMWEKVGLLRDGAGLTQALEELERLAELSHPRVAIDTGDGGALSIARSQWRAAAIRGARVTSTIAYGAGGVVDAGLTVTDLP